MTYMKDTRLDICMGDFVISIDLAPTQLLVNSGEEQRTGSNDSSQTLEPEARSLEAYKPETEKDRRTLIV
jgi:hypothetical protein